MDKTHPLSSPMVVRSLDVKYDPFRPCEKGEVLLDPEVSYLSTICALMYLVNCTHLDIVFLVNLLARYSSALTQRHWNVLSIYYAISMEQPIWVYFTQMNQSSNFLNKLI